MSVPIVECFNALQGEGLSMGVPSIFVRTGGCTLKCEGFNCTEVSALDSKTIIKGCDSINAVNVKHFGKTWEYYSSFHELVERIQENVHHEDIYSEKQDIIFTGGEPTLHHKDDVLLKTVEFFISRGHRVWFETNGTVDIDFDEYPIYRKVNFSISVKMETSGEDVTRRWKPDTVNNYIRNTSNSYFKFVLSKNQIDSQNEDEIFKFLKLVPSFAVVYVMPLGETNLNLEKNAKAVYEYALRQGFRYSDRIHIRMYNDKKLV
jgi:organic radical activating enzyme